MIVLLDHAQSLGQAGRKNKRMVELHKETGGAAIYRALK